MPNATRLRAIAVDHSPALKCTGARIAAMEAMRAPGLRESADVAQPVARLGAGLSRGVDRVRTCLARRVDRVGTGLRAASRTGPPRSAPPRVSGSRSRRRADLHPASHRAPCRRPRRPALRAPFPSTRSACSNSSRGVSTRLSPVPTGSKRVTRVIVRRETEHQELAAAVGRRPELVHEARERTRAERSLDRADQALGSSRLERADRGAIGASARARPRPGWSCGRRPSRRSARR